MTPTVGTRARRVVAASLVAAMFGAACGSEEECDDNDSLRIPADEACPSSAKAEEAFRESYGELTVDGPNGTSLNNPVTMCWYRAFRERHDCSQHYTRDELAAELTPPASSSPNPTWRLSCDAAGLLYGAAQVEEVMTLEEALAATPVECPTTVIPNESAVDTYWGLEVGEFVGSDFFPATMWCTYEIHHYCYRGGCGKVPGWGLSG